MEPPKGSVLLVDPNAAASQSFAELLERQGYLVHTADSADGALGAALQIAPDILMAPVALDDLEPGLFQRLREQLPQVCIVALGEADSQGELERALRRGADRYLARPVRERALAMVLQRAMEKPALARKLAAAEALPAPDQSPAFAGIVGAHPAMQVLFNRVIQAARSKATVLVHGETGTGKELIASAIHTNSRRRLGPFVRLNCASLGEGVLESELFGHEKGSFTGAQGTRKGRFEQADGGTLFLDEISEIPPGVQVKLLRFLQERELERVGGNETIRVDVRVVAATNRDLRVMVEDGKFREDLYYRLNVVRIDMPPLRARPSDIPLLADHFLVRFAEENEADVQGFSEAALSLLLDYPWPGNVRELMNVVEQAVVLAQGPLIEASELPLRPVHRPQDALPLMVPGVTLAEVERYVIIKTLEAVDGSRHRAAEILGISRRTLQDRLQDWGIEPRKFTKAERAEGRPASRELDGRAPREQDVRAGMPREGEPSERTREPDASERGPDAAPEPE
ncbi:MAG TPA: sigma-54 dependent transcriptional regulator [Polyangiales bacterium]